MTLTLVGYWALAVLAVLLTGLFAGLETGVYTLNRVRLAVRAAHGDRAAVRLRRELADPNRTLSMLLIGTNAASYLASFSLAAILHGIGLADWGLITVEALVLAPVLFVFAETLPKDLFRTFTDHWTYRLSWVIVAARWTFVALGILPLVQAVGTVASRLLGGDPGGAVTARQHISQLIKEGAGAGVLSESQTTLVDRAMSVRNHTVGTEMIPWAQARCMQVDDDPATRRELMSRHHYTRMPVVDRLGRVVGILSAIDALLEPARPTAELMTDPLFFAPSTPLHEALRAMRQQRRPMAIAAVTPHSRPLGVVTLKDLVEAITGELGSW